MCNSPIKIKNPTKYLNNQHGQQYWLWVNCGKCNECRQQKQHEWNLRTYYQMLDCLQSNGKMYFDTLTYSNENLPRLSNYNKEFKNYPCFDYKHIREFYENLRGCYGKKNDRNIIYFITAEYGDIRKRPHYHILLFLYNDLDLIELSKNVSKSWKFGRTDGQPYKSKQYVYEHNILSKINLDVLRYIAKYINKSCQYMDIINKRWIQLEKWYEKSKYNKLEIKRLKRQYYKHTTPFHRQSQHYGENALLYFDINKIIEENRLYYKDDSLKINAYCSLPTYFKRKLFQQQITYNGKRMWINNEDGIRYKNFREKINIEKITDRLNDLAKQKGIEYADGVLEKVAQYILLERGRLKGKEDYKPHHEKAEYYNYNTDKDEIYLGKGIRKNYHGNEVIGYHDFNDDIINIDNLIYFNQAYENIINDLQIEKDDKTLVILKEHLNEIKKIFFK